MIAVAYSNLQCTLSKLSTNKGPEDLRGVPARPLKERAEHEAVYHNYRSGQSIAISNDGPRRLQFFREADILDGLDAAKRLFAGRAFVIYRSLEVKMHIVESFSIAFNCSAPRLSNTIQATKKRNRDETTFGRL